MTQPSYGQAGEQQPPVCPRHPDRVSYVRCQRCGRPTCPECQRPASVGVQCVDCVAQAQAAAPRQRTVFGGRVRQGRPVITLGIIALCVAAYVLLGAVPEWRNHLMFAPFAGAAEPWRFISTAFLHGGFLHLALNMYALWIVGSVLEPALGRWRFVALYLLSALGGSVAVLLFAAPNDLSWVIPVVGASGAVFGLFGAIAMVLRRLGRDATQIVILVVINAVLGFMIPNIAWEAHLGGLVTGLLLASAYVYAPKQRRTSVAVLATVGVAVIILVLAVLKYSLVP